MVLRFSYIDQVLIESGFFPGKILGVLYMKFFYSENADSNGISSSSWEDSRVSSPYRGLSSI